ncbi:CG4572 [Drosophila busckii]|uniref:Carboxypeptidase n=1 Tax=Drosophila busckii TaxID=30019 RepID=A0A0M4EAL5_DROBS|nr:venom serine carboxypeptidase [Drosophila busckii]ALC42146.1 CG4572 [Drosophila busckii]
MQTVIKITLLIAAAVANCCLGSANKEKYHDIDPGKPLFLTTLIRNATVSRQQIKNFARVNGSQFLGVESYAGYLTVEEKYNSSLYFWYFPAEQNADKAPVVLWLQGGPGSSSLIGLFIENGPLQINEQGKLEKRNYTWSTNHNIIYVDNPVGTGFSTTDHCHGYARNQVDVAVNLYEAITQLYELFEWKNSSGFWITGESYAGKYVPALAYYMHKMQTTTECKIRIPLKGVAIGNGLSDPLNQLKYGDYLYQLGFIDDNGLYKFHSAEESAEICIQSGNMECAFEIFDSLILGDLPAGSLYKNLTGFKSYYNYLKADDELAVLVNRMKVFLQANATRRAIHVGNMLFHDTDKVNKVKKHLRKDYMDTVAPLVEEILKYYTVCVYSGQLDVIVPYTLSLGYLKLLDFPGAERYRTAARKIWRMDGDIVGYFKEAGRLIEIMIRNAGHLAPYDQPKVLYEMITRLTHNY